MKSSESSTRGSSLVLEDLKVPENIKNNLINVVKLLKNSPFLRDNSNFSEKIFSNLLLIGKDIEDKVYVKDVANIIRKEYPDILKNEEGKSFFHNIGSITEQLCFNTKEWNEFLKYNYDYSERYEVEIVYREELEDIVNSTLMGSLIEDSEI